MEKLFEDIAPDSPDFHFVTRSQIVDGTAPEEQLILTRNTHNKIANVLQVPELGGEVERAVWQVTRQMREQREQQKAQYPQPKEAEAEGEGEKAQSPPPMASEAGKKQKPRATTNAQKNTKKM